MNNRSVGLLKLILGSLDFFSINVLFLMAQLFFRRTGMITLNSEYVYFILSTNILWIVVISVKNIYDDHLTASFEQFVKASVQAWFLFLLLMVLYLFFFRMVLLSRLFIFTVLAGMAMVLLLNRFIYLVIYRHFKRTGGLANRVVIIGYNNLSKKLVDYLSEDGINKQVVGFCEQYENIHELTSLPILSEVSEAIAICKQHGANEIYSTIAPEHNHDIYRLIQSADQNCIRFRIVPDLGFFFNRQMHIDYFKEIPVINLRREPLEESGNRIKKRLLDIAVSSLVILCMLSWLIPLIGLLIKLESRGSIFFGQLRTGKQNRNFRCLKFRSMYVNTEANVKQATRNDQRITPLGRFLRRTNLDELPQFINVWKGEMSLVGPRPHMLRHTDEYSGLIGQYMVRQFVKPGITGWAQVNGLRGETKTVHQMKRRVEHDIWYMEHWSLILDLKIMMMTVFNTIRGEDAF